MPENIKCIIDKWEKDGVHVSDEEANFILWYCNRKMDAANVQNKAEYLPILYEDELKNYMIRQAVNATALIRRLEAEGQCVQIA